MPAKPALGLFFTDNLIEVSQISTDGVRLTKYASAPLPPNLVVNGEIKNQAEFVTLLQQLLRSAQPHPISPSSPVVVGVPGSRIFLREFTLPPQVSKELDDAVDWRIRSLLPLLPSDVETGWQIIGRDANDQLEVLLAAVPKTIIRSYYETIQAAGLQVIAIEPAVFANIRIITPTQLKNANQLLVHIGSHYSEFTYITNGNPRFSDFLSDTDIAKKGSILDVIREYVNFANSKHPTRQVESIIVSGSHPQITPLVDQLKNQNTPAILATSRLSTALRLNHSLLHTSHGLSLRPTQEPPVFNLLPLDIRLSVVRRRLTSTWKNVLTLQILASLVLLFGLFFYYQSLKSRQAQLTSSREQLQAQLSQADNQALIQRALDVNLLTEQFISLRSSTGGEERILREISATAPEGIALTSLLYNRDPASVKLTDPKSSWIITGTANSRPLVLSFYDALRRQSDFTTGRLFFGSLERETALTFRIASTPVASPGTPITTRP